MTNTTITRTPKAVITPALDASVAVPVTVPRRTLRQDLDAAAATLAEKKARVTKYKRRPAKNAVGEPLPMPLRFSIALTTATRRYAAAVTAYEARYGVGSAKRALSK